MGGVTVPVMVLELPGHIVPMSEMATFGKGFTVTVKFLLLPGQFTLLYLYVGVTVMVPLIGALPAFVPVNAAMELPLPLAPRPMAVFVFDHA